MRKMQGKSLAVQNQVYQRDTDFDEMMARKLKGIKSTHFWGFQGSCHASLDAAKLRREPLRLPDATTGIPPAPADPFANFTPSHALGSPMMHAAGE